MPCAVKICGITSRDDASAAVDLGARALGFVFYRASPRYISATHAAEIIRALPPFVTSVGLFVNAQEDEVRSVLDQAALDLLQFHGEESPDFCARFGIPYIKAARVQAGMDLLQYALRFSTAKALLLDAFVNGTHGGTGVAFDWNLIPRELPLPIIVSGGLHADNVGNAIRTLRPWAVDVSSGVEAKPGIKDHAKLAAFMQGVRNADL
ncbi:MAG: phosphoribosylanthranilate isomerase [Burkholderiales bacterium]|nr:phosphoribosylanthranilate isomerase [Burkholderiales bacterium]